jgi:hypothetical protein
MPFTGVGKRPSTLDIRNSVRERSSAPYFQSTQASTSSSAGNMANDLCLNGVIAQHGDSALAVSLPEPPATFSEATAPSFASRLHSIFHDMHGGISQKPSDSQITAELSATSKLAKSGPLKPPSASRMDADISLDFFLRPLSDVLAPALESRNPHIERESVSFSLPSSASSSRLLPDHYYCR